MLSAENDSEGDFLADKLLVYLLRGLGLLPYLTHKYVAGAHIESGLKVSIRLNEKGLRACLTLIQLPDSAKEAQEIAKQYEDFLNLSSLAGLHASIGVSLPQLGFHFDQFLANELALCLLTQAARNNSFVWVDVHELISPKSNLESATRLNRIPGLKGHLGLTLQADVYSVQAELDTAIYEALPVRLRSRAPSPAADPQPRIRGGRNIRQSYMRCVEKLLQSAVPCSFATLDEQLLDQTIQYVKGSTRQSDLEFEFPYHSELAEAILKAPLPVTIEVPVGVDTDTFVSQRFAGR